MTEENFPYQRIEGAQALLDDVERSYGRDGTDSDYLLKVVQARVAIAQAKTLVMIEQYLAALVAKTPDLPLAPQPGWPTPPQPSYPQSWNRPGPYG